MSPSCPRLLIPHELDSLKGESRTHARWSCIRELKINKNSIGTISANRGINLVTGDRRPGHPADMISQETKVEFSVRRRSLLPAK
jgi:hypothetical protein